MNNEKHFPKIINQWDFDYGLFTSLPKIVKFSDFSPSLFKLKRDILPLLTKYVSWLGNYLSYQAKIVFVNLTPKELTPCKISHIFRCAFKRFRNYVLKCDLFCISWYKKNSWFPVKKWWWQQSSRSVSRDLCISWIFLV